MSNNPSVCLTKLPRPPQRPPACRACKRRKSKCDFEQPCSTCLLHNTVDSCYYDTLTVPREHRSTPRLYDYVFDIYIQYLRLVCKCPSAPSSRTKQAKTLKVRLAEAENMIVAQQQTIESLRLAVRTQGSAALLHNSDNFRARPEDSHSCKEGGEREDPAGRDEDGKTHSEDLADKMTRLVIGSAISPTQPEVPEQLNSSSANLERTSNGEAHQLQLNVLALLASHNNDWAEFARRIGVNPSHATSLPPPPLVSSTIIPEKETITNVNGLVSLFPPTKAEALALLETYLSFVNLVHHVVDGPQTRFEIELFYDLIQLTPTWPVEPSPMPVPPLIEPGWLSAMLAIFTLADKSDRGGLLRPRTPKSLSDSQRADGKSKIWLEGSLQGLRMRLSGDAALDITALRSVCLVVWVYVLYGQDDEILPAVNLNSRVLYQACDKLQLHRDPSQLNPQLSPREAEDRRRVFYSLINTDWLFSAISGKTYSPVGIDAHDVRLPRSIADRDPIPPAISGLAFRSKLMRQLRKLATLALLPGGISQADAASFETDLDRLDQSLPSWCDIDVDNFPSGQSLADPQQQAEFSQKIITNVQLCAVRVRFHTKFASPGPEAPAYMHQSASRHRAICISRAASSLLLLLLHCHASQFLTHDILTWHSGYPRFHPIVGGLTLSALMASQYVSTESSDPAERRMLFDELSRFTAVIHSYGALSQVTNLGILAIETALAEERRGALALRTLPVPASGPSISQQKNTQAQNGDGLAKPAPYYPAPLASAPVPFDEHLGVLPHSERPAQAPLKQPEHRHHMYRPAPIMLPPGGLAASTPLRTPSEICLMQQPQTAMYDVLGSETLRPPGNSENLEPSSSISAATPSSDQYRQFPRALADQSNPIDRLFSNLGGVGYEGLMVGWMGSGINVPAYGNHSDQNVIPAVQNTWKQEW
ncbi:uncharacterized protein VP01_391g5 [Puccinia sorghi]|uniref:Zn(2)-C6 fungal-type domain-containing protein n=1 Tax=Puccinia sorghi TaxID=27349 RepID=A0A0L6UTF5_9BASI|nr:uncharacterized protein VP01_391g5 [Puccinia sorghi]